MENKNNKNAKILVPIFVIFFVTFMLIAIFTDEEPGLFMVMPIIGSTLFFVFIFVVLIVISTQKKASLEGKNKSDYNHNRTFHKSEWERLGISPNDFSVDDGKYKKSKNSSSKKSSKSSTKFDYEKMSKEEKIEVDSIINRVLSESIDEEGKNWKESFNNRLSSSYDPTKDIKDETRSY